MMDNTEKLIAEYSRLTGRPLATISVAEYLEFRQYADKAPGMPVTDALNMSDDKGMEPVTESIDRPLADNSENIVPIRDKEEQPKDKSASSAFMLMRSIKG